MSKVRIHLTYFHISTAYRRILDTAGKGYPTALPAGVGVSAVEINVEIPVIRSMSPTARPLQRETGLDWKECSENCRALQH